MHLSKCETSLTCVLVVGAYLTEIDDEIRWRKGKLIVVSVDSDGTCHIQPFVFV